MSNPKQSPIFERHFESHIPYSGIDGEYLELNVHLQDGGPNFPNSEPVTMPTDQRRLPRLGPLFNRLDVEFLVENKPAETLTVGNFCQFSQKPNRRVELLQNSDLLYQGVDPRFFEINGRVIDIEDMTGLFEDMPAAAWRGYTSAGFIQVTDSARKHYGLTPKIKAEMYPKFYPDTRNRMGSLPNVNIIIADTKEAGVIVKKFEHAGLKHNFMFDEEQTWGSAFAEGQIYTVLSPTTSILDSDKQQREFLQKMLGAELTPERDEKIRADGGFSNVLAYYLVNLIMDSTYFSLQDYRYVYQDKFGVIGHRHSDPGAEMNFAIRYKIQQLAYGVYNLLCNKGFS